MITNNKIKYVATLQELGRPYSMLFVDKGKRQLYVLVRVDDNNAFVISSISAQEVMAYISEKEGLINILESKPYRLATIENHELKIEGDAHNNFSPTDRMRTFNMFDPELCEDDVWLEVFLNRLNTNQPLEIVS